VELARKLAKEMDDHRTISVSRVYVPNEYTVYLAPDDREQFSSYESSLVDELQDHLSEHARREDYALLSSPKVSLETDDDLAVGEFGIATRMVQPQRPRREAGEGQLPTGPGETMVYRQAPAPPQPTAPELGLDLDEVAWVQVNGERHDLDKQRIVLGRSRECDIQISDPNVSRRHAEFRREGGAFWLVDLGSTNGVDVNGRRQHRTKLRNGDRVTIGTTEFVFRKEKA
jgi:hypothetical protein